MPKRYPKPVKVSVKCFSEDDLSIGRQDVYFSTLLPTAVKEYLLKNMDRVADDLYLICPVYGEISKDSSMIHQWDVQLGGTGTAKKDETLKQALVREALEEFKIVVTDTFGISYSHSNSKKWAVKQFFAHQFEVAELDNYISNSSNSSDDPYSKCGFLFWATAEYWMQNLPQIDLENINDNIINYYFISKNSVMEVLKTL